MNVFVSPQDLDEVRTLDVLGVHVAALGWDEALATLYRRIERRQFTPVAFLNAHNANIASADRRVRRLFGSFLVLPDGVGVDLAARMVHGSAFPANLNGTDFVPELVRRAPFPLKVGLVGASRENADGAAAELRRIAPNHDCRVIHDGFFSEAEEPALLARIAAFRPDILLVAMGVPRQEFWIAEKLGQMHCTLPIAVGALLDFLSGSVPRAPDWIRKARLEWLFRLWIEPGRLWRRYVLGNPVFLARVAGQKLAGLVR